MDQSDKAYMATGQAFIVNFAARPSSKYSSQVEIQHSAWEGNCTDTLDTDGHYLYESSTATAFLQLMAFVASNCSVDLDNVFGPSVAPCRRSFDFTQLFEESVMGLAPSSLLIVAAFLRLWRLQTCRKEHKRVWNEALRLQKLVALAGLTAMSLVLVVFLAVKPRLRGRVTQIAAIMSFLDTLLLVLLSNWEHLYSIRPSILLEGYLALSVVLDAARARTYWMIDTGHTLAALFSTALAIKIAVLILESRSKRPYLRGGDVLTSTEQTAGMFSLAFWAWLLTFLMKGYRYGLTGLSDLISIDDALLSIPWNGSGTWNTNTRHRKHALFFATLKHLGWSFYTPIFPRLAMSVFTYTQPLLLTRTISYVSRQPQPSKNVGYGLIGAYVIVYMGLAVRLAGKPLALDLLTLSWKISSAQYWRGINRFVAQIRGILVRAIYEKIAFLTRGQDMKAVTLMSTDIQRIADGINYVHEIWASTIEAAIAVYLLQQQIGILAVVPIGMALLSTVGSSQLAILAGKRETVWLAAIERRLKPTIQAIRSIKEIKMLGLEKLVESTINELRIDEVKISRWYRDIIVLSLGLSYITLTLSPVITFGVFSAQNSSGGQVLDASRLFTSLSLINLLASPLITLLQSLPRLASAIACFSRIQSYLDLENRDDYREIIVLGPLRSTAPGTTTAKKPSNYATTAVHAIQIHDGSFAWAPGAVPVLNNINLSIHSGNLTVIVGPSGSGKSTLLKGILGESCSLSGKVSVASSRISFADQNPWLSNTSVLENITGYGDTEMVDGWYEKILKCCVLDEDLEAWESGDKKVVGSRGINLSGGQRQRVALARAIYNKNPIILLDDVLSGLDTVTEMKLLTRLLGTDGLLSKHRPTIVIATHSARVLRYADYIIALDMAGSIVEQGTFKELGSLGGYVQHLCELQPHISDDRHPDEIDISAPTERASGMEKTNSTNGTLEDVTLVEKDEKSAYRYYFRAMGWFNVTIFFIMGVAFTFFLRFSDLWVTWWSTANAKHPGQELGKYLGVYAVLQVAALCSISLWAFLYLNRAVPTSGIHLHGDMLHTVVRATMEFFSTVDSGITTNRFSQDIQLIDSELSGALINATAEVMNGIAQIILIAAASAYICLTFPFLAIAIFMVQRFYLKTSRPLRMMDIEAKSPLYTHFVESIEGLVTIRAFGWQQKFQEKAISLLDISQKPFYLLLSVQRWLNLVLDLLVGGLAVIVVGLAVGLHVAISPSYIGVSLSKIMTLGESLRELVVWWTMLEMSIGAVARIRTFTKDTTLEPEDEVSDVTDIKEWPSMGAIEFHEASAAYYSTGTLSRCSVLKDISLSIPAGQHVGICGRSGSGKSSMIGALCRLLELHEGHITIDGLNIKDTPRNTLRSRLNIIPQLPFFIIGSIRTNLNITSPVSHTDEELWGVIEIVRLTAAVQRLGGLDAELTDESLSQGQKQLFCLARALIKKSHCGKVLLLDEATSSVDEETDQLIQRVIRTHFAGHTVLAVAHRLKGVLDFDAIVILNEGDVIEYGPPKELLRKEGGAFRELYDAKHV